jgi:hypothetical protein
VSNDRPTRYAVIPTHNRPAYLYNLVRQLAGSCDTVVIIDNASDPPVEHTNFGDDVNVLVIRDQEQPPNLARLWNVGLAAVHALEAPTSDAWDVAILNDDVELPSGWYDYVAGALRSHDVIAASGDAYGNVKAPLVRRDKHSSLGTRMCPWAFVIRGECGVEADEQLRWWWQDTDIEWRLAITGGVVVMPGYVAKNLGANSTTHGLLAEQAGRDGETFARKWGQRPW